MPIPDRIEPTAEAVAEMRARLRPKRVVRARLGILHNGQVPIEEATIDPTRPRTEAPDDSSTVAEKKDTPSSAKSAPVKTDSSAKPADASKDKPSS